MTTPNDHTHLLAILILTTPCSTPFAMALDAGHIKVDFLCGKIRPLSRSSRLLPGDRDASSLETDTFLLETDAFSLEPDAFSLETDAFSLETDASSLETDNRNRRNK